MNVENLVNTILTERVGSGQTIDPEFKDFLKKFFPEDSYEFKQIMYVVSHHKFKYWMTSYDYDTNSMKIVWRPITCPSRAFYEFDLKYFYDKGYNTYSLYRHLESVHNKPFYCYPLMDKIFYIISKNGRNQFNGATCLLSIVRGSSFSFSDKDILELFRKLFVACLDITINDFKLNEDYSKYDV